jgi:hypothetical protein
VVCPISPANRPSLPIEQPWQGAQSNPPKLRFSVFVSTAECSWVMRINPASFGLRNQISVQGGRGRPRTAPRRRPFLIRPARRQAFPSGEFT